MIRLEIRQGVNAENIRKCILYLDKIAFSVDN